MYDGVRFFWQQRMNTAPQPTLPDSYLILGEPISAWPLYQPPGHPGKIGAACTQVYVTEESRGTRSTGTQFAELSVYLEFVLVGEHPLTLARFGRNLVNVLRHPGSVAPLSDQNYWGHIVMQTLNPRAGLPPALLRYDMSRDPASKLYRLDCAFAFGVMSGA